MEITKCRNPLHRFWIRWGSCETTVGDLPVGRIAYIEPGAVFLDFTGMDDGGSLPEVGRDGIACVPAHAPTRCAPNKDFSLPCAIDDDEDILVRIDVLDNASGTHHNWAPVPGGLHVASLTGPRFYEVIQKRGSFRFQAVRAFQAEPTWRIGGVSWINRMASSALHQGEQFYEDLGEP